MQEEIAWTDKVEASKPLVTSAILKWGVSFRPIGELIADQSNWPGAELKWETCVALARS